METTTTIQLEQVLESLFITPENDLGLGKIIYNKHNNESIISNGTSLITYAETQLEESTVVSDDERMRISNLAKHLIHRNYCDMYASEMYLNKTDVEDILQYIKRNPCDTLELKYNKKLNVLFIKTGDSSLMKILNSDKVNQFKSNNIVSTIKTVELHNILTLMLMNMNHMSTLAIALQYSDRPVMLANEGIFACVSCIKK